MVPDLMRLLVVAPNIPLPGVHGGSTHVTELVRALRKRHEVVVLARRGSSGAGIEPIGFGSVPRWLDFAYVGLHLPAALRVARAFRPDAIYERFSARGLGVLLGKALGVPVVSMVLDTDVSSLTLRGAARLITTAPQLVPEAYHHKLTRVHWGANTELFRPDVDGSGVRERLGIASDEFVFGYTGAFYPWHGLDVLVAAVKKLEADPRAKRFRFLLVGDGATRAEIEASIDREGVRHRFVSVGRVPYVEVPSYVAACDACLAAYDPSRHPKLKKHGMFFDPLKVFEYLASEKPTVLLDSQNIREILGGTESALLVEPGSADALASAMLSLAADPARARAMAESGRKLVTERYSWQAHGDELGRIFEELVGARS
jgi:glycosyltransferase involved in cell wall biosynthesis